MLRLELKLETLTENFGYYRVRMTSILLPIKCMIRICVESMLDYFVKRLNSGDSIEHNYA